MQTSLYFYIGRRPRSFDRKKQNKIRPSQGKEPQPQQKQKQQPREKDTTRTKPRRNNHEKTTTTKSRRNSSATTKPSSVKPSQTPKYQKFLLNSGSLPMLVEKKQLAKPMFFLSRLSFFLFLFGRDVFCWSAPYCNLNYTKYKTLPCTCYNFVLSLSLSLNIFRPDNVMAGPYKAKQRMGNLHVHLCACV